ncbi:MAG: Xaa-Pro peptidase family protein [Parachlamydia sp.]|nr:Xaa-Pro peptidase family protein [Parachlamydia sp.]
MNYIDRIQKLKSSLQSCEAILIEKEVDLFYLTGLKLSSGSLLVHAGGACLLVDGRYYELCRKSSPVEVLLLDHAPLSKTISQLNIGLLGFDADATTYQRFIELQAFSQKLQPFDNPVKRLRMIKDSEEIALLRQAAALGAEGFDFVASLLREEITENEVALELEIFWKRRGSKGVGFEPIIAFGSNSAMPHYRSGNVALKAGMIALIDIGVNYQNYLSDMTRVLFLGEPDPKLREIYSLVAQAQKAALSLCRPGTPIGQIDHAARELISKHGYGSYFTHSLGHGVGLEIHELPTLRQKPPYNTMPLEAGMCITIEPGIYLPGLGGVRLEDTIVVTDSGYENLTNRSLLQFY